MRREAGLLQALTASDRLSDLLPELHHRAVSAVQGRSSILFRLNRTGEALRATSAFGLEGLPPDAWPARLVPHPLLYDGKPVFMADLPREVHGITGCLESAGVVLVPLAHLHEPLGLLLVGTDSPPSLDQMEEVASVGHAFVIALERTRVAGEADLQLQLRNLIQEFLRSASSRTLTAGLDALCAGANRLFGADRTSVWLHDRRARMVVLSASSDIVYLAQERRIATSDALAPAAVALRRERAEIVTSLEGAAQTALLTIPLKGQRRALGTIVMEQVRLEQGSHIELLERADEMGRQLSGAIENVLLLEAVLRARRELENTFSSLSDLVAVSDQAGRLVQVNRAFLERTGKPAHEVIDRPLADLVGPATVRLFQRAKPEFEQTGAREPTPVFAELEDPILGATFAFTVTGVLGEAGESLGHVLVARDVTRRTQLEAERAELRNRLVQSEKLAALGQFGAGIAHELNNPLQGVLGHLELLRATGAFPKELRRELQRIHREADRAAKIVRNLLLFAGSHRLTRRRTSINATVGRALALRASAFRAANIKVVRRHEHGLPRLQVDPLLLQQAFLNIVLNAEQAVGSAGGRIETRTGLQELHGISHIFVQIRDTGPGIAPAGMARLFEPFYTTKAPGKGTGLGLAIAYGIIQEHGGQIVASNHPQGGAVFTVQLPVETG